jgi:magnesium-transporting ATPase (P-type)
MLMLAEKPRAGAVATTSEAWHASDARDAIERLQSSLEGLSEGIAAQRLAEHGPNSLPERTRKSALQRLLLQFHNLLIYVLIAAGVVTALIGHLLDAAVIMGVVVINAVIGFVQETRAEKALDAIREMLSPEAAVLRDGRRRQIPAEELVPGDLVLLEPGDRVPADLRLLRVKGLQIQEAVLTGESVPVTKGEAPVAADAALGDRASMAWAGTMVTGGTGRGLVVATGGRTELGRISAMIAEVETLTTPLMRELERFARWLTAAIIALAAASFAFGTLVRGMAAADMFLAAVGIAVAAIPEGLPAIMTIALAIGVQRMARRNAIVRLLPAVETLGSVSVICSDKTGTLTKNEMMVERVATAEGTFTVTGEGYAPVGEIRRDQHVVDPADHPLLKELGRAAVLCNDARIREGDGHWRTDGDPMEGALLALGGKLGLDAGKLARSHPRLDAVPFESERRWMATLNEGAGNERCIYVKGAPERLLELCDRQRSPEGEAELDLHYWHKKMEDFAGRGERLLAVAVRRAPRGRDELAPEAVEEGLTLLGVVGLADPPREEAIGAVRQCQSAGIRVKMITGDHAVTARAIAERLGLETKAGVLTGRDLDELDERALAERAGAVDVFARTSPEHKLKLVQALQSKRLVCAMTGDGVNDAPALKRADVGIAMGARGTEAAKEAAEIVLADDNFASIAHAVEEGRTVYDNLKKALAFILPTNGGQAFVVVAAILAGTALPITAVQILWVNMVTAVSLALALAFEPTEADAMRRPPRAPDEPLLSPQVAWRVVFVSAIMLAAVFGLFVAYADESLDIARTMAINVLVGIEIFYLFNCRHLTASGFNLETLFGSRPVLVAIAVVSVLQLLFTYAPPFQFLFGTAPLELRHWIPILAVAPAVFFLVEAEKALQRRWQTG